MSGLQLSLVVSVFLACAVEAVEAFTIVLAVASTRRWSSALAGPPRRPSPWRSWSRPWPASAWRAVERAGSPRSGR